MDLCGQVGATDFSDACVGSSWTTIVLTGLVSLLCLFSLPLSLPEWAKKGWEKIRAPFRTYIELHEAEALHVEDQEKVTAAEAEAEVEVKQVVPLWRTFAFAFVGLVEVVVWICIGSYRIATKGSSSTMSTWLAVQPFLMSLVWLYTVIRPISRPTATPPYDLFVMYILQLVGEAVQTGGSLYRRDVLQVPLPSTLAVVAHILNAVATLGMLSVVLGMPMAMPSNKVNKAEIGRSVSPEDYTTLFGWVTFWWVYPLVKKGKRTTLNENDVWGLGPTFQSRPIFIKFMNIQTSSLLKRLIIANSLDLILDFMTSNCTVLLDFLNPFFLNRILASIEHPTPTAADRSRAYIYAVLMFLCSLLRSQCDLHHLWFGRRAATRIRSELMARIYEKALKRKDMSGSGNLEEKTEEGGKEKEKETKVRSADTGKIVNLMANDANRVSMTAAVIYMLYNAPVEIIIGLAYLYRLLGVSAFAGLIVLIAGWPLNHYLTNQSMAIYKGNAEARDKRMSVVNELIGAIKFIKFFAWEDRWIGRVMEERQREIQWMLKGRINSVLFYCLWQCTPILVSIISFSTYVLLGNQLTIAVAFTAIALFAMIRTPLNVLPNFVVQVAQTGVALNRIATYLEEEEVDDLVSSLQKERNTSVSEGLGLEGATLHWNEAKGKEKNDDTGKVNGSQSETNDSAIARTQSESSDSVTVHAEGNETDHRFELRDVSVKFPEGELAVVTGPTASGKTALLMAVLGEMTLVSGRIILLKDSSLIDENGYMHAISYAAQTPWLRHQSIKDNILFGYPLDEERYEKVIEACALKPDLEIFEDGDKTEIGARGVSLSGGQKARVALARAVYARTKYVLLDDPLSAVDSHTARFLYEKLLRGPLLHNRTVVLVTHHVDLVLPSAHYLVRMLDGRIDTQGTIKDLRAQGVLEDITHEAEVDAHKEEMKVTEEATGEAAAPAEEDAKKKPRKLVEDEHRETGSVKWGIYKKYLQASSYWVWGLLVFFVILNQLLGLGEKFWINIWGEAYKEKNFTRMQMFTPFRVSAASEHEPSLGQYAHWDSLLAPVTTRSNGWSIQWPNAFEHPLFYVGVYAAIGVANALVTITATAVQYTGALKASRILFKQLLVTVVRATFRFHDTTPQGRMLNRFGKDIETIDSSLAGSLQNVNSSLANFFASVIIIAVVFPFFLLPAAVLGFLYRELAVGYLNTGRDLRRMESNSRSPIFSDFGELLEGIVTVRAFSAEKRFLDNLHKKIDATTQMWYAFWMTNRWLLLSFDALGSVAVLITALFSISNIDNGAGLAGICITSALSFTMSVYWACRFWTQLELDLNSVERIVEYLELPQEPPAIIESSRPAAFWPSNSRNDTLVAVENLSIKYAPGLPSVIQDVSFTLRSGERVGLLGRTGSGKSTLAMSILRFVDPSEGRILIDGIDISTIGIHDLRSRITFIPQDATLFSGTLRDNLDSFGEYTDAECMDVLYRVHMISQSQAGSQQTSRAPSRVGTPEGFRSSPVHGIQSEDTTSTLGSTTATGIEAKITISLETKVSSGGMNFSQGQRQLIAMARALLRRSSIIILDEATSSIDFDTDAKIQAAIREEFTDSLLLTVAHRLRTVIDYDRLIVLDKGRVAEFDTPLRLIQKEDGIFRNMCLKSGTFAELEASAKAKAELNEYN